MKRIARFVVIAALSGSLLACGSKTQLLVPSPSLRGDAGPPDAGPPRQRDAGTDAGPLADECIELPYRAPPSELDASFTARIQSADIHFLVDVTGSMSDEIARIRDELRNEIVPGLAAEIPEVRFSVAHFADFALPDLNYGDPGDELYRLLLSSSDDVAAVQHAVDTLPLQGGRDGPEALVEALYLSGTGAGFGRFVPPATCPADTVGYPCFQAEGSRIFLVFTDAPTHNGPGGHDAYRGVRPEPHEYDVTVAALRMIGAKVLGLYSGDLGGTGESDLVALARDTGAVREDGSPIVFEIGTAGELLGTSVVEAVRALVEEVPIDVDVVLEDAPGDALDATSFVERVLADHAEPASGAVVMGDRFAGVRPGTRVFFRIVLANERIEETDAPQSFLIRVVLRGDGATRLSETLVRIVVPALSGAGCEAF